MLQNVLCFICRILRQHQGVQMATLSTQERRKSLLWRLPGRALTVDDASRFSDVISVSRPRHTHCSYRCVPTIAR